MGAADDLVCLCQDNNQGRYITAGRPFARGEVILTRIPDVWAPFWPSPLDVSRPSPAELVVLRRNPGVKVTRTSATEEEGAETFALLAAAHLLTIRALLMHGSSTWPQLLALDDNARMRSSVESRIIAHVASSVHAALADPSGPSETEVARILGAILVNAIGTRSHLSSPAPSGLALCATLSMLNHSCDPTAILDHVMLDGDARLTVRALRQVQKGEALTIAYVDSIEPRYVRRQLLLRSKNFACGCARCASETDGDRFGSALQCNGCSSGWQREAVSPAAIPGEGSWRCVVCGRETAEREVAAWDAELRTRLRDVHELAASTIATEPLRGVHAFDAFRALALERAHPNHALVVQALIGAAAHTSRSYSAGGARASDVLSAANVALAALERTAPAFDPQKADLEFQRGVAMHALAQAADLGARRALLLQAAAALQRALVQFRVVSGEESAGSRAAHALARACMQSAHGLRAS